MILVDDGLEGSDALFEAASQRYRRCGRGDLGLVPSDGILDLVDVLVGSGEGPVILGEMMSDAWVSFARTGVPTSDLLPEWTPYNLEDRPVMQFDVEPAMVNAPLPNGLVNPALVVRLYSPEP